MRQVRLAGPVNCERDTWYFVADDRLVVVSDYRSSQAGHRGWSLVDELRSTDPEDFGVVICHALTRVL